MTYPTKKLGEVCNTVQRIKPSSIYRDHFTYIDISAVDSKTKTLKVPFMINVGAAPGRARQLVHEGDVIFATTRPYLENIALIDRRHDKAIASTGFCVISTKREICDPRYIFLLVSSKAFIDRVLVHQKGASYPAVSDQDIFNIEIPVPPIDEQKKIVERIEKKFARIDETVRLRAESFAATEKILPATLHEIFEEGKKGWEEKELGDLFDITSSKRVFQSQWRDFGIPFYRARELVRLANGRAFKDPIFISEEMYEQYRDKYGAPEEGDILATGVGTLGITYRVKAGDKFYFKDGNIIWFKKRANLISKFVEYFFKSDYLKNQIQEHTGGATVKTFTIKTANKIKIPLPPLAEQKAIVKKLDGLSAKVAKLRELQLAQQKDLKELKQSILHEAFSN